VIPKKRIAIAAILCLLLLAGVFVFLKSPTTTSPSSTSDKLEDKVATRAPSSGDSTARPTRRADRLLKAEGGQTDVSLPDFPLREYQHLKSPSGLAAAAPLGAAYIHVPSEKRRVAYEANQLGEYPTVETGLNDTVGVRLDLGEATPGTDVRVVILDGGTFPSSSEGTLLLPVQPWRGIAFEFATSGNIGTHRVLVQALGQAPRVLDFDAIAAAP